MSTAQKLATKLMKHYGLVFRVTKDEGYYDILMPYLLMDASYHYVKHIVKYKEQGLIKHKASQYLSRWRSAYTEFFDTLWIVFPEKSDERQDIIDIMDSMEEFVAHDIEIAQFCSSSVFMDFSDEIEDILTKTLMANIFSGMSSKIIAAFIEEAKKAKNIRRSTLIAVEQILKRSDAVCLNSMKFSEMVMGPGAGTEVFGRKLKDLSNANKALFNRITAWEKSQITKSA